MEELGRVVEVRGRIANIEFNRKEACAHCGASIMCHFKPGDKVFTEASNDEGAKVGDLVRVEVNPRHSVLTGFLIFIFPIVVFITVFMAVKTILQNESYGIAGGAVSLAAYFILLKRLEIWLAKRGSFSPVVRDIVKPADS